MLGNTCTLTIKQVYNLAKAEESIKAQMKITTQGEGKHYQAFTRCMTSKNKLSQTKATYSETTPIPIDVQGLL